LPPAAKVFSNQVDLIAEMTMLNSFDFFLESAKVK
jgi:hypothetical protein